MSNNTKRRSSRLLETQQPLEEKDDDNNNDDEDFQKNKKTRIDGNESSSSQKEKTISDYELLKSRNQFNSNKIKTDFSGAILVDVDLRNTYLADLDFRGADFSKSDLTGAVFFNSDLREAIFNETIFDGTYFAGANLSDLHFINNKMISCYFNFNKKNIFLHPFSERNIFDYPQNKEKLPILDNIIFENVNLTRSVFDYNTFINVRFLSGYLYDTSFNYSKFVNTTFVDDGREREADTFLLGFTFFKEAKFYKNINLDSFEEGEEDLTFANINSLIINCTFTNAVLNCMCFRGLTIIDTNFEGCNLKFSTFEKSKLDDVQFQSRDDDDNIITFESINFKEAVIRYINFRNARLSKINFRETIIRDTIFEESIFLEDISFESSRLFDVDFTNATFQGNTSFNRARLTDVDFVRATFNENTSFEGVLLNNVDFSGTTREYMNDDIQQPQQQPQGRGVAFEVHDAFEQKFEPKIPRFLEIINQPPFTGTRNELNELINNFFTENINRLYSDNPTEKAKKLDELERVEDQVFGWISSGNVSNNTASLIAQSLSFVNQQDDDFKREYITTILNESCSSLRGLMSCPKGIVERFMLNIGSTVAIICSDNCENETYNDLNTLLNPKIDKVEMAKAWWDKWEKSEELNSLSVEERKQKFIQDLIAEAKQSSGYYSLMDEEIKQYADVFNYAFEKMERGGNKRTKWGKRRATRKNVIIIKQNKRRKITKRINGKRQRKSKRYNGKSKKNNRKTKRK